MLDGRTQVWPHPVSEAEVVALINMTEAEINDYCLERGIKYSFKFLPVPLTLKGGTGEGELPPGLAETMSLNDDGVKLVVGHDLAQANHYCLDYANKNNITLLSPSGYTITCSIISSGQAKWSGELGSGQSSSTVTVNGATTYIRLLNQNSQTVEYEGAITLVNN